MTIKYQRSFMQNFLSPEGEDYQKTKPNIQGNPSKSKLSALALVTLVIYLIALALLVPYGFFFTYAWDRMPVSMLWFVWFLFCIGSLVGVLASIRIEESIVPLKGKGLMYVGLSLVFLSSFGESIYILFCLLRDGLKVLL